QPAGDGSGGQPPAGQARPGRRKVLLGLAGGGLVLAAAGGAVAVRALRGSGGRGGGGRSAALTDPARPLATDTVARPLWTAQTGGPVTQVTGEGNAVVAVTSTHVRAFDLAGEPLWEPVPNGSDPSGAYLSGDPAAVGGGLVFVVSRAGGAHQGRVLRALDLATGKEAWRVGKPDLWIRWAWIPGMLDGLVYVTGSTLPYGNLADALKGATGGATASKAFVWAVDPAARAIRWETSVDDRSGGQSKLRVPSSGSRLLWLMANPDGSVPRMSALAAADGGKTLWEQPTPGGPSTGLPTSYAAGFVPSWHDGPHSSADGRFLHLSDHLYAVDAANGQVAWTSPGKTVFHTAVAGPDGRTVYAVAPDHVGHVVVQAFETRGGTVRWAGTLPMAGLGAVAVQCTQDTVYLWLQGRVWALDADTGLARWSHEFGGSGATIGAASVALWAHGDRVYGATHQGLTAIASTGR
ncbi:PQQ-binding-like beta-propeller repeat protein, partial [Streptomyces sp. BR123]|uniref:outer membrane protein assembly factor BamB family protein n=1 Tax=Streptomyces sp. BR123 TaxID=2749828 RepID=UPI0015C4B6EA